MEHNDCEYTKVYWNLNVFFYWVQKVLTLRRLTCFVRVFWESLRQN